MLEKKIIKSKLIDNNNKTVGRKGFAAGVSGNPGGRPKLPEEIKKLKEATLEQAIKILHNKITDKTYISDLKPMELIGFLELAFDRLGLPKISQSNLAGNSGEPLQIIISQADNKL
jgi:hypothetical protein